MKIRLVAFALTVCASALCPAPVFFVAGQESGGTVGICDPFSGNLTSSFQPYGAGYGGGIYVATGDVNGDGQEDIITGPEQGGGVRIRVFDGNNRLLLGEFDAFSSSFAGGVRVASADVNGDGYDDIIAGSGPGGGQVKVFDFRTGALLNAFVPFAGNTGGVFVGGGNDGPGHAPRVVVSSGNFIKVFNGSAGLVNSFQPFAPSFNGGVRVSLGDVNGDGIDDIVASVGNGGGPNVRVFSGSTSALIYNYFAFTPSFTGGVSVALGDGTGDGIDDMYAGQASGGGLVNSFNGSTGAFVGSFYPFGPMFNGGLNVDFAHLVLGSQLIIQSQNPAAGVPITLYSADLRHHSSGYTDFTRIVNNGTVVPVTAPAQVGNNWFDHWERDGTSLGTARTLSTTMDGPHTIKAIFLGGHVITVNSATPSSGIPITIWNPDRFGQKNGITPFTRTYTQGTTMSLTAPVLNGTDYFVRWNLDGSPWMSTGTVNLPVGSVDRTLTAVYGQGQTLSVTSNVAATPITVWTRDKAGLSNGNTDFTRLYATGTPASLTAPASAGGMNFTRWEQDGMPTSTKRTVTVPMGAPHQMKAIFGP